MMILQCEADSYGFCASMAGRIVDGFFHDQVHMAALFRGQFHAAEVGGSIKGPCNLLSVQHVGGEFANALHQAAEIVTARVYRPHDIAHRVDHVTRCLGDLAGGIQRASGSRTNLLARHLAEDGHLRQTGSDFIVQICGNARPNALQLDEPRQSIAVQRIAQQRSHQSTKHEKPPALPDGGTNGEGQDRRRWAAQAIRAQGTHHEAIGAGRQTGQMNGSLLGWLAPLDARGVELVLVT